MNVVTHLYDPDSSGGRVGDHVFVGVGLSLLAILSELGIEGLVLALILFDLHRTREQGVGRGLELPKADESITASRDPG